MSMGSGNSLTGIVRSRDWHRIIADLKGKGGHIRTVPVPHWVKAKIDAWAASAGLTNGILFRAINKAGRTWGNGFTPKVIWFIVKEAAANSGLSGLAPHDLRRTYARLCHQAGGELKQIQFLLGHVSIETTERFGTNRGSMRRNSFADSFPSIWADPRGNSQGGLPCRRATSSVKPIRFSARPWDPSCWPRVRENSMQGQPPGSAPQKRRPNSTGRQD